MWLFGSRARGNYRADSDLDLAIGMANPEGDTYASWFFKAREWRVELGSILPWPIDLQRLSHDTERMQLCIRDSGALIFQREGCDCERWKLPAEITPTA